MYQSEVVQWNQTNMANQMAGLEFKYTIEPGPKQASNLEFLNRSMSYERDEIQLKKKL